MAHSLPLLFYVTPPERCAYLPRREAVNVFADPRARMNTALYSRLVEKGFRRSGSHLYRPQCPGCNECIPTRIPVARFIPNRSQRRNRNANLDLTARILPQGYRPEHFALYRLYQHGRHTGGEMDNPTPQAYLDFLTCAWAETLFVEFRLHQVLMCVAVCDRLTTGLSAVYNFFNPNERRRGLGTHAILWQIEEARRLGLDYVYLGYWIASNCKMNYKTRFRPLEGLINGRWRPLNS
ncbi:MAG TPA: arginyltransferase [Gammaproteobacteria bacterium]|jgi:arginyl-tRNA--protein-N-Asp/Glu arginylyltransferase|nr:arginyltransferase [Pseudomonadota bacterium]HEX2238632.1 arginyltransferase [Gammaproteobacteria bacterium]